ncbi:MAG: hypothetical protein MUF48_17630 [Pirellulaceae bacterium]|jgi:PBP1b-binding outer membrane lipoprotein LpoB|nr:hypothetical protein [Pirellulaceae bacterium]
MKKYVEAAALLCLAALWVGCQQSSEPTRPAAPPTPAPTAQTNSGDAVTDAVTLTLVKLKVPNMT